MDNTTHDAMSACVRCSMARDELVLNTDGHSHCDMCSAAVLADSVACEWCGHPQVSQTKAAREIMMRHPGAPWLEIKRIDSPAMTRHVDNPEIVQHDEIW